MKSNYNQNRIAIVGMDCILPQAINLKKYWRNIVNKINCITEVPSSRWKIDDYYDSDPKTPDKTYCKCGGFIPDVDFNSMEFGLPPNILEVTDVSQLLSLKVAKQALEDAGYGESKNFNRSRTGIILGVGGGQKLITPLTTRLQFPVWKKVLKSRGLSDEDTQEIIEKIKLAYIGWEENSFPGMLGNVIAGRIANRLDLGGINCVVDSACASSLTAVQMAIGELTSYRSDMMLTGGVDTDNSIFMYMCFSKTPAFSKQQEIKPFDANSDGMLIGEGIGMMVLKRLEDAQRDGDRIYATITGMGASSDGKYKSIYAPRSSGQAVALRRAYEDAGFSPSTVGLIEAHGTGTIAGDPIEFAALNEVFSENNPKKQYIALGSVKSQIGHTKATAGAASLIKAALALHHKILPPTLNVTQPNPKLQIEDSPFYLNTETRPWFRSEGETPRRAGVSSFGFGGTNFHVVLEEYNSDREPAFRLHNTPTSILLHAQTPAQLLAQCQTVLSQLTSEAGERHYTELVKVSQSLDIPHNSARVGFVTASLAEALKLLQITIDTLQPQKTAESWEHPQGIYYRQRGIDSKGKVVALFSGQGSQYLEMGKELVMNFPQLRQAYAQMDSILLKDNLPPISHLVFPPPTFEKEQKNEQLAALQQTENAQPAIGAFSVGLYKILQQAGFVPDFVAGHSFGELTALWAAEVLSDEDYFFLVKARGQAMASPGDANLDPGKMLAVKGDIDRIIEVAKRFSGIAVANWNANNQVVLAGTSSQIEQIQQHFDELGYTAILLPVSAAFHTPLVAHAQKPFARATKAVTFNSSKIPVYTNTTAKPYSHSSNAIRENLAAHILNPVRFKEQIENIYAAGGYFFVEFGSKNILTNLVKNILAGKPHVAVALNVGRRQFNQPSKNADRLGGNGCTYRQLREAVVQLRVAGLPLRNIDPYQLEDETSTLQTNKGFVVRLNGSNYVSEQTKAAFDNALKNGHQIKVPAQLNQELASSSHTELRSNLVDREDKEDKREKVLSTNATSYQSLNGKRQSSKSKKVMTGNAQFVASDRSTVPTSNFEQVSLPSPPTVNDTEIMAQPPLNTYQQQLLESLERTMMRFQEHQAQMLNVHGQYLKEQSQYSQQFLQLMQQQYSLLASNPVTTTSVPSVPEVSPVTAMETNAEVTVVPSVPTPNHQVVPHHSTSVLLSSPVASSTRTAEGNGLPREVTSLQHQTALIEHVEEKTSTTVVLQTAVDLTPLITSLLDVVSDKTGYPKEMLELEMDMEADLGIDSIKRVEILGAIQDLFPDLPQMNPEELAELRTLRQIVDYMGKQAPPQQNAVSQLVAVEEKATQNGHFLQLQQEIGSNLPDLDALTQSLLEVVSDKTGYPIEMLELGMDMEADLGIDSIKRVEILGAIQELFPDLPQVNPEELAEMRSLQQIVEYMGQKKTINC